MCAHQYDQQVNQVVCKISKERIYTDKYLPNPMVTLTPAEWDKASELYADYVRLLNL